MREDSSGWMESAAGWISAMGDGGDYTRAVLLDHHMVEMCGDVAGQRVLDLGCGEGRFCRMLSSLGASCVGIDPTVPLLEQASLVDPSGAYLRAVAEHLPLATASVDVVVSYITLLDIPGFRAAIREARRVLKPGGRFVMSNLAPWATTSPKGWYRDAFGRKLHFPIDNYLAEWEAEVAWADIRIRNYHRPLSAYISCFLENGFTLRRYLEPSPSDEYIREHPEAIYERRVPYVIGMLWTLG